MDKAEKFLIEQKMHYSQTDYDSLTEQIISEIRLASEGSKSSLSAIPCYLNMKDINDTVQTVVAVDAGGTNLRVALIRFDEKREPYIIKQSKYEMPGQDRRITHKEFFSALGSMIEAIGSESADIGISFAYKGEITPQKDYIIYKMCKEVDIEGINGMSLADGINDYFLENKKAKRKICAINDAAATLIGTIPTKHIMQYGACVGVIVGTGFNVCYRESSKKIKNSVNYSGCDIVVSESGYFDKLERGNIDKIIDESSLMPLDHYYEKMISGKYLPEIFTRCMQTALNEGLISDNDWVTRVSDGRALNEIMLAAEKTEDERFAKYICSAVIKRAAYYAASAVAASVLVSVNEKKTAAIVPEGSTILKLTGFMPEFKKFLDKKLTEENGISYDIFVAEDSVIKGASKAVIM